MPSRYPGYDVLDKRFGPSWNEKTREVLARRLALPSEPRFFSSAEAATVAAIAERIVPQPTNRAKIPVVALVDERLFQNVSDGYRGPDMPRDQEAWRRGLAAIDAEARIAKGVPFHELDGFEQDKLLSQMEQGSLSAPEWQGMSPKSFFKKKMARDIVFAYYSHPTAWSEIGWGGPASPRGYVRMDFDERDPWEAAEVRDGDVATALRKNRRVG